MPRYASRPVASDYWDADYLPEGETHGREVYVENDDRPTGILDARGDMIWRLKEPVGFLWHE